MNFKSRAAQGEEEGEGEWPLDSGIIFPFNRGDRAQVEIVDLRDGYRASRRARKLMTPDLKRHRRRRKRHRFRVEGCRARGGPGVFVDFPCIAIDLEGPLAFLPLITSTICPRLIVSYSLLSRYRRYRSPPGHVTRPR